VLDEMIREELFVQRGLELDFPGTDPDTRSALVAAVEQQVVADVTTHQPADAELQKYFEENRSNYATEGTMARAISVELGLPRIDLAMTPPEPGALGLLDARTCIDRFLLPVALREGGELLWLAMADPTDPEAIDLVRRKTQKRVRPAVAGPSEILRAVRTHYGAGSASTQPEDVQREKLAAIEIDSEEDATPFEVVNVADDIEDNALSRIAKQLGVEVPPNIPSRGHMDLRAADPAPPKSDRIGPPFTLEELFTPLTRSMEKAALVLRTLAELCVEKGVITREEFKKRKPSTDPVKPS